MKRKWNKKTDIGVQQLLTRLPFSASVQVDVAYWSRYQHGNTITYFGPFKTELEAVNAREQFHAQLNKVQTVDITSVSYGRTVNINNFESVRVDWEARVHEGQTAEGVLELLRQVARREIPRIRANRE